MPKFAADAVNFWRFCSQTAKSAKQAPQNSPLWRLESRLAPTTVGFATGSLYFRLNLEKSGERWREIRKENRVAVRWAEMSRSGFELKLCYVLKAGDEG